MKATKSKTTTKPSRTSGPARSEKKQKFTARQRAEISIHSFNLTIAILTVILVVFIGGKIWFFGQGSNPESESSSFKNFSKAEKKKVEEAIINSLWEDVPPEPFNEYVLEHEVYAYFIGENQTKAITSATTHADKVLTVHPFWYRLKPDMTIEKLAGAEDEKVFAMRDGKGIQIIPTFSNHFDSDRLHKMLVNSTLRDQHIEDIIKTMKKFEYEGVDIDYENIKATDKEEFSEFVRLLSERVHKSNRTLTIAVHAKVDDQGEWHGPAATDYSTIGKHADRIMVMAYDYHWGTSPEPGDIAPVSWADKVLQYTVTKIDKDKVLLGMNFYGYDWGYEPNNRGVLITYKDMLNIRNKYPASAVKTSAESEKYFTYSLGANTHTVYFADHDTVVPRLALVKKYGIAGIGIWRIGDEDDAIWAKMEGF